MWEEVSRAAAVDATTTHKVLGALDYLGLVHCQSWTYDHPVDRLADRLGIRAGHRTESILAGTSPQRLVNEAASRMLQGHTSVALIVGGEALATRRQFAQAGVQQPWSHPHPSPPASSLQLDEWYLPTEIAHGVLPAWLTFALLEQARWAARGDEPRIREQLHRVIGLLREVADTNPDAWFTESRPTADLVTPSETNRMVASPYTKRMTAFPDVDMAAANLLVTKAIADKWCIPDENRVYLRGWGFARDAVHVAARARLDSSPAMANACATALYGANMDLDDIDVFDLYSCFGSAVQFATDALGLSVGDERPISVTGGLPYHGGPSSNYMSHSLSHMTTKLRSGTASTALTTGIGMHMTKHVAAVWSRTPGLIRPLADTGPQRWVHPDREGERAVAECVDGTGTLVAATVVYDSNGQPDHVIGICDLDDGTRCYGRTGGQAGIVAVLDDQWANRRVRITPGADRTNVLSFSERSGAL